MRKSHFRNKKRQRGIKKIIILLAISLSIIMLVNNIFKIIISGVDVYERDVDARRVYVFLYFDEYDEIGGGDLRQA